MNTRLYHFTHDIDDSEFPRRLLFDDLQKLIDDFFERKSRNNMVIMPGFRGVGKTTLMAQLCKNYQQKTENILFLSIEDTMSLFNAGITEVISAYEDILGIDIESVNEPVLIFFDEVQTDPKWAIALKSLFERTSKVFFCCSGSSSISLQTTSNLARRAIFKKMPPMSFTEYQLIANNINLPLIGKDILSAIYFSSNSKEVYEKLAAMEPEVNKYWFGINRHDIKKYLTYGSLPFSLTMPDEFSVYNSISMLLDKIIKHDLPNLGSFDNNTLSLVKRILFIISENDTTSVAKLEEVLQISKITIANIFDALEKAELLIKVPAYGSNMSIAKKPSKFLFMSPSIRMSFFYFTGQDATYQVRLGKLLEDSIGLHLYNEFLLQSKGSIRYDSASGGADFILQLMNNKQIIIEVGLGNKDKKQIITSSKKISSDYNLIFSRSELSFDPQINTVFVPLDYYFLM